MEDVTPRSRGHEDVTATYIYRLETPPHVYTLSISTSKNQSKKVCGTLYILTYGYNYKVIIGSDTILQEYYITDRRKCENIRRYTIMKVLMTLTSDKRKTREVSKRPESIGS